MAVRRVFALWGRLSGQFWLNVLLGKLKNQNLQDNDLPEQLTTTDELTGEKFNKLIDDHGNELKIWISDKGRWLRIE